MTFDLWDQVDGIVISIVENAKQNIQCSSGMYEPSTAYILFFISN